MSIEVQESEELLIKLMDVRAQVPDAPGRAVTIELTASELDQVIAGLLQIRKPQSLAEKINSAERIALGNLSRVLEVQDESRTERTDT